MLNPETSFAASSAIVAQQAKIKVKGTVVDQSKTPVIGASVAIKGTTTGTMTDVDGKFTLDVPAGSNLTISAIGYKSQSLKVTQSETINIVLESDNVALEQVVVVGFGTQKKENLTGAVSSVDVKKALDSKPITNLSKGLQGITPGLTITYGSGSLANSPTINVRGAGTIIDGTQSGSPLILVDGIPVPDLSLVNPDDVANISVLKDAASASIYGARAAFGVILITTKSGKSSDKISISYSGNFGVNKPTMLTDFLDPEKELPVMIATQQRAGNADAESFGMKYKTLLPGVINWKQKYANNRTSKEMVYGEDWEIIGSTPYFYRVWDPNKEMLSNYTPQTTHNIQLTGKAGENSTFLASVGYSSEKGILKINPETKTRYSVNLGFNTQIAKWLKGDFKIASSTQEYDSPYNYYDNSGTSGNGANGYFGYYMRWGEYFPYGTYKDTYFRHAPGFLANANMNKQMTKYIRYSTTLTADITNDLKIIGEYSLSNNDINYRINGGATQLWDFWSGLDASTIQTTGTPSYVAAINSLHDRVAESRSSDKTQVVNAYANYSKTIAEVHNIKLMAGINSEWNHFDRVYSERRGLMDRDRPEFRLASGDSFVVPSSTSYTWLYPGVSEYAIAGFFARANYDYKGKYLLELNARYDGSSNFPTDNQWGFFPSASIGYRISQEPFMQGLKNIISDAKLRASIGSIGNQNVAANAFRQVMSGTNANWINGTLIAYSTNKPNDVDPNLTWEKVVTTDLGTDIRFLNNMFGISFDWYQRNTTGMLAYGKTLPSTFGTSAPYTNSGNLRTRGFELSLDFNKRINPDVSVYANLTLSDYKSIITKWNNPSKTLGSFYEGMELGEIWGLSVDRLYQESDFTKSVDGKGNVVWTPIAGLPNQSALAKSGFSFGPGDVKYNDLNQDGKIDAGNRTVDNPGDLKVIGNTTPRYQYGIRLGANLYGFDVDVFLQGVGKRSYWASSDLVLPFYNRTDAMYGNMTDYWTPTNTNAYYPNPWVNSSAGALAAGTSGSNNFVTNDRYLLDMAYLRFKNLTVGYTIPQNLTKKVKIERARVYFSGQNLMEHKNKHLPVDPEINETEANWGRTYPYMRTFSMGLQVNF
jgi:TonB-linked SusC/RagA family outer membrane protein